MSTLPSASIKKELGEALATVTKAKSNRKLILVSNSEQTTYEGVAHHIHIPTKKKLRTLKIKGENKNVSVVAISLKATDSVPISQVFVESVPPIVAVPISAVPGVSRTKGVVFRDPLPKTTKSSF